MDGDLGRAIFDVLNLGVTGLILWLWMTGRLTRPEDCAHRVAAAEGERDAALDTLAQVRVDRDTWREACLLNAQSRQAADMVNRHLADSGRVTTDLVQILRDLAVRGGKED